MKLTAIIGLMAVMVILTVSVSCVSDQDSNQGVQEGETATEDSRETGSEPTENNLADPTGETEEDVSMADLNKGLRVWLNAGCTACHQIGDDPGSNIGPNLTDVGDKFTRDELIRWLRNPLDVDPEATMPAQTLSDEDLEYLARYLSLISTDTPSAED
ncbi:c-type cytochrome [bacterium]|nr:c-type cytochrome [bacterium]